MKLKTFLSVIFILLFLPGQGFAEGSKFDRGANSDEVTAQTRDDIWLSPSSIPHIMAAPGTVSKFQLDHNVELLNADRTILITDKPIQWYDPNGSDRNVTLSAEASSTDLVFTFYNDSDGAGEDLVIRDDTPTTLITIGPGQGARVSCDGTDWKAWFDSGVYWDGIGNTVGFYFGGTTGWNIGTDSLEPTGGGGGSLKYGIPTATAPSFYPRRTDSDTGIGWAAVNQLSLIAGGVEGQRIVEANSVIYNLLGVTQQDSVIDGESNTSTTISSDGAAGDNFLTTCQIGDAVLIRGGTTTADYGLYWITAVTDDNNLVINTALSATDSDIDFYILRNGRIATAERTWYLEGSTGAGTTPVIVGLVTEAGLEKRYTIGLDEKARTMVVCDAGDVDTDFGLGVSANPVLWICDAAGTSKGFININTLSLTNGLTQYWADSVLKYGAFALNSGSDLVSGNMWSIKSNAGIELTDTDGEQSWLYIEPKINQSATAAYNGLKIKVTETATGDATTGDGGGTNNLILAGTSTDPDMFKVDNVGRICVAESSDPTALADHVFFYGKNVTGTAEAFAADAGANAAQLTPHNFTLFEPDSLEAYPWSYYAENKALGIKINVDMAGAIRAIEQLTGKTFIYTQNIAKEVNLEKVYKDAWMAEYIKAGIQETEITKVQALETVQVDADKWYLVETPYQVCDENGTCVDKIKIVKQRNKIGETIIGYELVDGEVKPKIETLYETEKVDKIQIKAGMSFDEADGKFYLTTKPTKAQAITAATIGFKFEPPKWLRDRLEK